MARRGIQRNCLKPKNKKSKQIRVKFTHHIASIVDHVFDGDNYILFDTDDLLFDEKVMHYGCSFHTTPKRNWFTTYQCANSSKVQLGKNTECNVVSVGNVKIKMHDYIVRTLTRVRHVLQLKKNLIILSTLNSAGCQYISKDGFLQVVLGALVMMRRIKHIAYMSFKGRQ